MKIHVIDEESGNGRTYEIPNDTEEITIYVTGHGTSDFDFGPPQKYSR